MSIWCVVGVRPNFIKISPLVAELDRRGHAPRIIHTGQHYDERMSGVFFEELGIRDPDAHLNVGSGSHAVQTAEIMLALAEEFRAERPRIVVLTGETNSSLAAALTAAKLGIRVAHIEAGLRYENPMRPQAINRRVIDAVSSLLFTHSREAAENLKTEGRDPESVHFVGSILIDVLKSREAAIHASGVLEEMRLSPGEYGMITVHQAENVDDEGALAELVDTFRELAQLIPLVMPVHPRTRNMLHRFGLWEELESAARITLTEPLGYFAFQSLLCRARFILTDSGGVQEESTVWGVPCLTLGSDTARRVTIREGANRLVGRQRATILHHARRILAGEGKTGGVPELWDGRAAERIADILLTTLHDDGRA